MLRKKREQHASKTGVDKKGVKRGDKGGDGKVEVKPCSDKVAHTFMVMGALFFLCTSHSPPTLNTRVVQPGTAHDGMFRSKELRPLLSPLCRDDKSIDSSIVCPFGVQYIYNVSSFNPPDFFS